jgi:hypothetical protein
MTLSRFVCSAEDKKILQNKVTKFTLVPWLNKRYKKHANSPIGWRKADLYKEDKGLETGCKIGGLESTEKWKGLTHLCVADNVCHGTHYSIFVRWSILYSAIFL